MMKKVFFGLAVCLVLTGCFGRGDDNDGGSSAATTGVFLKSVDGGRTFSPFVARTDKGTINNSDILSIAINPLDTQKIYLGTKEQGILVSANGAATWSTLDFPPNKVYGIVINPNNPDEMYATGVWQDVSKLYKSVDAGESWDEIYLEPITGTVITSLALHPRNPQVLYAGISSGVVVASRDAGLSWQAVYTAKDAVTDIVFDQDDGDTIYLLVHKKNVLASRDGGQTFEDTSDNITDAFKRTTPTSVTVDPARGGRVYIGSKDGIFRSDDAGVSWEKLPVIGSSEGIAIRALAIDPFDPEQITYAAGQALYTSRSDAAAQWVISEAVSGLRVDEILHDPFDPDVIYVGLRRE